MRKYKMYKNKKFDIMSSLKYLIKTGPSYTDEWTEAGMYHIIKDVINGKQEEYSKKELDELLVKASNF